MEGRYFEIDEKICLIFSNEHYGKLREIPEFAKTWRDSEYDCGDLNDDDFQYADMPCAREWANDFEEGIKAYGFSDDQIKRYNDVDNDTMG